MPTTLHPQAKFDPIPPDLNLYSVVEQTANFKWVQRVSRTQIRNLGQQEFEKLVHLHVIVGGKPLVIDGWDTVLPKWLFSAGWLEKTYDKKQENVRDIVNAADIPMTTGHYLRSMKQLTNQWTPNTYRDERRQRLYLKDIDCPPEWQEALQRTMHPSLFYLNENVTSTGGSARQDEDSFVNEATAAPAGDLMSSLPETMRAENLMCYIGHEGTYTPAHREMCASLGQNIMVEASADGNGEKSGSSVWFMTESKDREVVREYFLSMLGHDIEIEKHFAQINAWKKAPFDVYIVEQRAGDFILIPPLAAHQVWNRGTRTVKVAWNRTTVETLDLALHEALPKARLVCRDEQYKNKAIIYFTLEKYFKQLLEMQDNADMEQLSFMGIGHEIVRNSPRVKQLAADFRNLFGLFSEILLDEAFALKEKSVEFLPFDSCVTCSYCRSNIFNRFLTCKHCVRTLMNGDEDAYDICMECYAMGRSCACISGLQWCEQWPWEELVNNHEAWRAMVIVNDGFIDVNTSPQPFEVARQVSGKKSVAHICQEALRRRPWKDITKRDRDKTPSDSEPGDGDETTKKKYKRKKKKGDVRRCHVCCHKDYTYRIHMCSNPDCSEGYCYGVLYRAFDMMPQSVLEKEYWQCPKCLGICNCAACRRTGNTNPYMPKNTLLGHDTRPIADDRSVEALVDFRVHNLSWLKAAGEESRSKDSRRMQRLREQADNAKAQDLTHQVEAEQAMQEGHADGAMNGYGDQSHVLGEQGQEQQQQEEILDASVELDSQQNNVGSPEEQTAAMAASDALGLEQTARPEEFASSAYPDPEPLPMPHHRLGMGYYEQDDTPDKILFDEYQAPSADYMALSEPDVPENAKKAARAAKKKAKRELEDPDFVVGRSHQKKPRLAQNQADMLDNMDPALLRSPASPPATARPSQEVSNIQPSEAQESTADGIGHDSQKPIPALRHAKPLTSYIEVDDHTDDEYHDTQQAIPHAHGDISLFTDDEATKTAEAAANVAASIEPITVEQSVEVVGNDVDIIAKPPQRKRGRPPKRHTIIPLSVSNENTNNGPHTPPVKRGRGRPRKSTTSMRDLARRQGLDANDPESPDPFLDDSLVMSTGKDKERNDADAERERRRMRRSGVATTEAPPPDEGQSERPAEHANSRLERGQQVVNRGQPRRRGRPRKSEVTPRRVSSSPTPELVTRSAPVREQYMSMAERMALRGKKFKIGKRKSGPSSMVNSEANTPSGTGTPDKTGVATGPSAAVSRTPEPDWERERASRRGSTASSQGSMQQRHDAQSVNGADDGVSSGPARPTIVKLADIESPEDSAGESPGASPGEAAREKTASPYLASGDSDSDSNDDIPSGRVEEPTRRVELPLRGSSRGRGRGRPPGRWRGRGRGRGR